jgi:NADH-quinone oxidoreductase subunit G
MATIYIEGKPYDVKEDQSLLQAALSLGFNLPYFCWHPALGSVGACRQCAVKQFKDKDDTKGRIVMACMEPAKDGTRISIEDPEAVEFRRGITEFLMVNHPHDCPICDEGGECHLQDMTVMTGHAYRRHRFTKRTYQNQYLGPLINHEMNRCIQCYRCVRFYRGYAGGRDLDVFASRNHTYFGRHADGVLESEFSGNLVEVCPTGVFTDKTLKKHYTRKWDLQTAPSVCVHCGLGCNTIAGERYGTVRRILNRYNYDINGYFLCDRGRYGYEFVNNDKRVRQLLRRSDKDESLKSAAKERVLEELGLTLREGTAIGIGSPRASVEGNYALRSLVGPNHFFAGVSVREYRLVRVVLDLLKGSAAPVASLREIEESDAALVLGEDAPNTAPRLALSLRQTVRQQPMQQADAAGIARWKDDAVRELLQDAKGPLFIATPAQTHLDDTATRVYRGSPDAITRLGMAIAHAVHSAAPEVAGLDEEEKILANTIGAALREAESPVVISGTSLGSEEVVLAAASVAGALCAAHRSVRVHYVVPECNSLGLGMMGGSSLGDALAMVENGRADTVLILENDLYSRASRERVDGLFRAARRVVVLDHTFHETADRADLLIPVGTFAESHGTYVNSEGRAQRFFQVFVPESPDICESWRWIADLIRAAEETDATAWDNLDALIRSVEREIPDLSGISEAAPPGTFRIHGLRIPREPARYSGRTAMHADQSVHEPKPPMDADAAMSFTMEGYPGVPPAALTPFFWAPGWNSVQGLNKFQEEVGGPMRKGPGGHRLIEGDQEAATSFFSVVPPKYVHREGKVALVPLYHIFGSERLSMQAPWIRELAPESYVALNRKEAEARSLKEGDRVEVRINGTRFSAPLRIIDSLPPGVAGIPAGHEGLGFVDIPGWADLAKGGAS